MRPIDWGLVVEDTGWVLLFAGLLSLIFLFIHQVVELFSPISIDMAELARSLVWWTPIMVSGVGLWLLYLRVRM
jgi:hypothetical protein